MTVAAVACQLANVTADVTYDVRFAADANRGCLVGHHTSESNFSHKHRRRVIAQAQTGSLLDRELTVGAGLARLQFEIPAKRIHYGICPGQSARGRAAHARDRSTLGLAREHLIEIDDAVHIG